MASLLEAIGNVLSRKTLSDEQVVNAAAIRSARGDEPRTEKEIEATAEALQRLGKDAAYLSEKIEVVKRHDQAVEQEKGRDAKAAEASKLQAQYDSTRAELEPINSRLQAIADKLTPLQQQLQYDRTYADKSAAIRQQHPELFLGH